MQIRNPASSANLMMHPLHPRLEPEEPASQPSATTPRRVA
jgi:hypothetical protein